MIIAVLGGVAVVGCGTSEIRNEAPQVTTPQTSKPPRNCGKLLSEVKVSKEPPGCSTGEECRAFANQENAVAEQYIEASAECKKNLEGILSVPIPIPRAVK